ncbi:MAG: sigma-70 family RNA polymerase sigma factor [Acidobacteria bacterium]|nr:sigma-70 family RNA polymerase sigma factor [Acidobacteriota bacterium]
MTESAPHAEPFAVTECRPGSPAEITRLLHDWQVGNRDALDRLIPLVYQELRAIASGHARREWREGALRTTAIVHEAYLKLLGQRGSTWENRAHFFAIASRIMRRVLLDQAKGARRAKRGGSSARVTLDELSMPAAGAPVDTIDLLDLDRALTGLERLDPDQARLVELRFFGGLSVEETALVLRVSPATVKREWAVARGWLHRALTEGHAAPEA